MTDLDRAAVMFACCAAAAICVYAFDRWMTRRDRRNHERR